MDELIEGLVEAAAPLRLDVYIAEQLGLLSRSQLKSRCLSVSVNGRPAKLSRLVQAADTYRLSLAALPDTSLVAEDLPLEILYEDDQIVVVNKAQGMVTHPAHGNWSGTLANALLSRLALSGAGQPARGGIVHRLDKDTSGVLIAAKTAAAQEFLSAQFRARSTGKYYLALVAGCPKASRGRIDNWLARDPADRKKFAVAAEGTGKRAVSQYLVLESAAGCSLLLLKPATGRTHQLRVHCRALGCPILGDPVYGTASRQFSGLSLLLHAAELHIVLPGSKTPKVFRAALPPHFMEALRRFGLSQPPEALPYDSFQIFAN